MKSRLTEIGVKRVAPDPRRRLEIHDELAPGLMLRVTESGKKSWSVLYRVAGQGPGGVRGALRRITLGHYPLLDLRTAREQARAVVDAADHGRDPARQRQHEAQSRQAQTVSAVSDRFIALYAKPNTKKWREAQALLQRYVLPGWGEVAIHDIRRADAHELLDRLVADGRVAMAREVRKHLTKLFNWSVDRGIVTASPLAGMERPEIAYRPRERVLSMEELRAISDGAEQMGYPFGPLFRLLIFTGQRRSEIALARRRWLLQDLRTLEIPAASYKTGRPHAVPSAEPSLRILASLPRWSPGDYFFSTTAGLKPVTGFSTAKVRLDRLSKVHNWVIHDLRRSVATHMARLGVPQEHIERVLGHVIEGVAGTYNRYSYLDEKRAALELWGRQWS
ncbi:MAG: tyrosine-type recombinase/integrase [Microvirga sp.]